MNKEIPGPAFYREEVKRSVFAWYRILRQARSSYRFQRGGPSFQQKSLLERLAMLSQKSAQNGNYRINMLHHGFSLRERLEQRGRQEATLRVPPTRRNAERRGQSIAEPSRTFHLVTLWACDFIVDETNGAGWLHLNPSDLRGIQPAMQALNSKRPWKAKEVLESGQLTIEEHQALPTCEVAIGRISSRR